MRTLLVARLNLLALLISGLVLIAPAESVADVGLFADCSAAMTTGGTAQQLLPANTSRRKVILQNVSVENIGFSLTRTTTTGNGTTPTLETFSLTPGMTWTSDPDQTPENAIWINAATTGSIMVCARR